MIPVSPRRLAARALLAALLALPLRVAAAAPEAVRVYEGPGASAPIVVRGTTDIALFDRVLRGFVAAVPGASVRYEQWGSNALHAAARAACAGKGTAADRAADLLVTSAVDLSVDLVNRGCARPHAPAAPPPVDAPHWRRELFGITLEPAVIVYNRDFVSPEEAPASRFDILDLLRPAGSRFAGRVATYDIEASGLGYLLAFMDSQQATTFGSMIEAFARSGAVATCCSAEIIDGVVEGRYLIAYNVLGSYALARAQSAPSLAVVAPSDYTLLLRRTAMIPKGAADPEGAGRLLDFILSEEGRRLLARDRLIVDPTRPGAAGFAPGRSAEAPLREIPLSPVLLVGLDRQKRAAFIALWRETFEAP